MTNDGSDRDSKVVLIGSAPKSRSRPRTKPPVDQTWRHKIPYTDPATYQRSISQEISDQLLKLKQETPHLVPTGVVLGAYEFSILEREVLSMNPSLTAFRSAPNIFNLSIYVVATNGMGIVIEPSQVESFLGSVFHKR